MKHILVGRIISKNISNNIRTMFGDDQFEDLYDVVEVGIGYGIRLYEVVLFRKFNNIQ